MLNITVVEDHAPLRESLVEILADAGHHVAAFDSAESFFANSSKSGIDVLVLDLNLPGQDGLAVAARMRGTFPEIGIIMLSARGSAAERSAGYDSGADIYLTKPASADELTAALRALSRRILPPAPAQSQPAALLPPATLRLDAKVMMLTGPAGRVALSASEAALLEAFARSAGNRLENAALAQLGTGGDGAVSKATLGVKIVRLRQKLMAAGADGPPIRVIRNWGYQLTVPVEIA